MRANIQIDHREIENVSRELATEILRAGTRTVRDATRRLERDFESLTRVAVPGRAWRAWKSEVYPSGDTPAYMPSGEVFVSGGRRSRGMMQYWTQPGVNRAKNGFWLAIPTAAAGSRGRGRDLTPGEWERRMGMRLRFVFKRGGKYAYLVADGVFANNGSGILRKGTDLREVRDIARKGTARERVTVIMFVLIPEQIHANRVALEPAIARARDYTIDSFNRRLNRLSQ